MDSEKRWQEEKQFILFILISSLFILGFLFYLFKEQLAVLYFKLAYYNLLIAEGINSVIHNIFSEVPILKEYFYKTVSVDFSFRNMSFIAYDNNGNGYALMGYTFRYLWPIDIFLFLPILGIEFFILNKLSKLSNKFHYEGIKNKQISLYFNDKELQKIKRKTIKTWDTVNQEEIEQFVFYDYFPPYFPEDEGWFRNYIENSIYYSLHEINTSEERYNDIKRVWESIVEEHKVTDKKSGKKKLPVIKKYQFKRFEYMDKENLLDDFEMAEKELSIFITNKNESYDGVPVKNLFNSENSNEAIKKYIRKYYNEFYISKEEMNLYEDEKTIIDWTHILLEDLKIFFEVKLFRKDPVFSKTYFNETKKNEQILTPLLLIEKFDEKKKKKEIEENLKRKGKKADKELIKKELEKIKKEFAVRNSEIVEKAKKYYKNLKFLVYSVNDPKQLRFKQPVLKRTYIMTPFNGMKSLSKFQTAGIQIPAKILEKYIIEDYEGSIKKQIKEIKEQIKSFSSTKWFFKEKIHPEEIENLKALVAELETKLDKENEESRKAKITKLLQTHKFEETYLLSLWEYSMTLINLPTGRLSIIKKDNIVLWYALTSLGRPFTFKAGVPIEIMRQIEIEKYSVINRLKEKFEDPSKNIRDFISPETLEEIRRNSLEDIDEDEDEYIF